MIIVNRTDVTSRSEQYDSLKEIATDALDLDFEQVDNDDAPIADSAPAFADTVHHLDAGSGRHGGGRLSRRGDSRRTAVEYDAPDRASGPGLPVTVQAGQSERSQPYADAARVLRAGDRGQLRLTRIGGSSVGDRRVRYVSDCEVRYESWDGTVSRDDLFTSDRTVDGGTQSWVTWRPETVDAAVLIRFETPA